MEGALSSVAGAGAADRPRPLLIALSALAVPVLCLSGDLAARGAVFPRAGAGMYAASSDQLERFRAAVDDDRSGRSLERIVTEVRAAGITLSGHDTLKTAPRGYTKDHPRIELLRYKGLVTWQEWPAADWLDAPRAKDRVAEFFRHSAPLQGWLAEHVGPAQTSEARQR